MPRKIGILAFSILVLLASFAVRWYNTGGGTGLVAESDTRVESALTYLSEQSASARLVDSGIFLQAWVKELNAGHEVYVALEGSDNPWLTWVRFDQAGSPVSSGLRLWTGIVFPDYLRNLSLVSFAIWVLLAFVVPHVYGVKCPCCPKSFVSPPMTDVEESTAFAGGFDADGHYLPEIVRRDYVCPRCGYRKITYYVPPSRAGSVRDTPIKHWALVGDLLNVKETEWFERLLGRYEKKHEGGRGLKFPTYGDWKTFYEELKASEREVRPTA